MKLGKDVLVEIVNIVRQGLVEGKDISQGLRDLDLVLVSGTDDLALSNEYIAAHPRASDVVVPSFDGDRTEQED